MEQRARPRYLSKHYWGWWSWIGLYRWVIQTAMALIIAIGAFAGTVLLFQQNQHLDSQDTKLGEQNRALIWQNEMIAARAVSDIRAQFPLNDRLVQHDHKPFKVNSACPPKWNEELSLHHLPNMSETEFVMSMAKNPALEEQVIRALRALLRDSNGTAALGALIVLDSIDAIEQSDTGIMLSGVNVFGLRLENEMKLGFSHSRVVDFACPKCSITFMASYANEVSAKDIALKGSFMRLQGNEDVRSQMTTVFELREVSSFTSVDVSVGNFFLKKTEFAPDRVELWTAQDNNQPVKAKCEAARQFCEVNPFFEC